MQEKSKSAWRLIDEYRHQITFPVNRNLRHYGRNQKCMSLWKRVGRAVRRSQHEITLGCYHYREGIAALHVKHMVTADLNYR